MSTPAGWYDDGSGRQRWWDGSQWTENYVPADAPLEGAPAGGAPAVVIPRQASTLGFIGLGLAVVGTVLACIPAVATFGIGVLVLLAAFVVSLIAVFRKNTAKWPSIVGMALSVIGGIVGAIVLVVTLAATALSQIPVPDLPTAPSTSEQPSAPPATGDSEGRPSPDAIGAGWKLMLNEGGYHQYDDNPEFFQCIGQYFYDSDLSDELLRDAVLGVDNTTGQEREHAIQVGEDATYACDPDLQD